VTAGNEIELERSRRSFCVVDIRLLAWGSGITPNFVCVSPMAVARYSGGVAVILRW